MQELNMHEIEEVSGGVDWKTVVWVSDQFADFVRGFSDGWAASNAEREK